MTDDTGKWKVVQEEQKKSLREDEDSNLTGDEIDSLADLFASAPVQDDDDEDTGPFEPVRDEDTGPFTRE